MSPATPVGHGRTDDDRTDDARTDDDRTDDDRAGDRPADGGRAGEGGVDRARTRTYRITPRSALDAGLAVLACFSPLVLLIGPAFLEAVVGAVLVLVIPGAAIVGFRPPDDALDEVVVVFVVSLAIAVLGTQLLLAVDHWSPFVLFAASAGAGVVLARHAVTAARVSTTAPQPVLADDGSGTIT
jgi:hypothetical protein